MNAAEELVRRACAAGWQLAVAESCTGGEVTAAISAVPGASACLWGGAVVYSAAAKQALAGVPEEVLRQAGTVSEATSAALALAIRDRAAVQLGLAATGWAGPEGDDVGAVYLAVASAAGVRQRRLRLAGSRTQVRAAATSALLELALEALGDAEADT